MSIFDVISFGCEDFIQRIHLQHQQERLLCGVVPKETIASLLFDVIERTNNLNALLPIIPDPIHTPIENRTNSNSKEDSSNVDNQPVAAALFLRGAEFIRQANFRLLQLARPESIYFCKLPQQYIEEYMLNQEHLSIVNFFRNLTAQLFGNRQKIMNNNIKESKKEIEADEIQQQLETEELVSKENESFDNLSTQRTDQNQQHESNRLISNKWCIFTRSSSELHRLHLERDLDQILMGSNTNHFSKSAYFFTVALHSINSMADCDHIVNEFLFECNNRNKNKINIFICTVDVDKATSAQVNYIRNAIDGHPILDSKSKTNNVLIIFIFHFPPEIATIAINSPQHVIYFNNWEFIYIDAFGRINNNNNNNNISNNDNNKDNSVADIDARMWLASAFGLKSKVSDDSIMKIFQDSFFKLASLFLEDIKTKFGQNPNRKYLKTQIGKIVYGSDAKRRKQEIEKWLKSNKAFVSAVIELFAESWTENSLKKIVEDCCKAIIRGEVVGSLLQQIRISFDQLLQYVVHQAFTFLLTENGFDTIINWQSGDDEQRHLIAKIFPVISQMIEIPVVFNVFESQVVKQNQFSISFQFPAPSCPFYDVVEKGMNTILYRLRREKPHSSLNYILEEFGRRIARQSSPNLKAVCNFISSNKRCCQILIFVFHGRFFEAIEQCFPKIIDSE